MLSQVRHIAQGIVPIIDVLIIVGVEVIACVGVFMAGYAVGRFRKRRAATEDVIDTFS